MEDMPKPSHPVAWCGEAFATRSIDPDGTEIDGVSRCLAIRAASI